MTLAFRMVGKYYNTLKTRDIEYYIDGDVAPNINKYSSCSVECYIDGGVVPRHQ